MFLKTCLQLLPKKFLWNMSASSSKIPLKKNISEALKKVKDYNRAQEFCHLLLDAKTVIHKSENIQRSECCLHPPEIISLDKHELDTQLIIYKLQDVINKDKPDYFLANFMNLLTWSRKECRRLNSLLSKFGNLKSYNSREYLKQFIDDIECFLNDWLKKNDNVCYFIADTKGTLKVLEYQLFYFVSMHVSSLSWDLQSLIDIKHDFSDEEEKEFQTLITEAVREILILLSHFNATPKFVVLPKTSPASNEYEAEIERTYLELTDNCYKFMDKVPLYHLTLKEKLLKYSKVGISCSNASKIFKILSELELSLKSSEASSLNTDLIMYQLKDLINAEKPENLVNEVLLTLRDRAVELGRARKLMLPLVSDVDNFDFLKPNYKNSKEYLVHFIQELKYLLNLYGSTKITFTQLERQLSYSTSRYVDYLLGALLRVSVYQLPFSEEEQREFSALMAEAIALISEFTSLRFFGFFSRYKIKGIVLWKRSSLQFFKDFCSTISANGETPLKTFDLSKIDKHIQHLDEVITKMCDASANECHEEDEYLDDDYSSSEDDLGDLEKAGAYRMPKSHTWWAKCLEILNEKLKLSKP